MLANINYFWLNPSWYNFMSSEWGGVAVKLVASLIFIVVVRYLWKGHIRPHFECHVEAPENCHEWGHPVPGTGHRACTEHHPHAQERGAITVQDIHRHHEESKA